MPPIAHAKNTPALFLHIQKTAGSSILDVARKHYGNSLTSHGDCWGHAPEEFRKIDFISGHFGYDFAKDLMPGRFSFTFLRSPATRVLSMYYFCKNRNPDEFIIYKKANELDLMSFLQAGLTDPWVKKNIWNNQVWQLAHGYAHQDEWTINDFSENELLSLAKEHIAMLSYVGFTETINVDAPAIFSSLGFPQISTIPKVNVTADRPPVAIQPPEIQTLLDELTFLDRQLYDYAWSKFMPARSTIR